MLQIVGVYTMEKQNFRPKEAAEFLGVGLSTIWMYVKQGKIKTTKLSERVTIIQRKELEIFMGGAA
ncbi:helix-turn-helix domain-containing protein [Sulfurovum sp.]|uniref:helix-turn-helix domain-containing protein n=1 Tax=Sulfurovum sp. TaxID=1969726 RepID=UPI0035667E29